MPIRFNTPGYDEAMADFVDSVVNDVIQQDPLLGEIPTRKNAHPGSDLAADESGRTGRATLHVEQEVAFDKEAMRRGDIDEFTSELRRAAEGYRKQVGALVVEQMREMVDAAGNSIDAGGQPLSYDLILDALESYQIDFAADGTSNMPTIIVGPGTAEILSRLEVTPAHLERLENILRRKKAEHDAQKRRRRLSGTDHDAKKRDPGLPE